MKFQEIYDRVGGNVTENCEYLKFDRIPVKLSNRPDLHAFILLDQLVPGNQRMVSAAEHDEFFMAVSAEDLDDSPATDAQKIDLIRCGVRYCSEYDSLAMFA